jgi:hypothetical protein
MVCEPSSESDIAHVVYGPTLTFAVANFFAAASCRNTSHRATMKISTGNVPVYTISGSEARPLPEWLIRKRKRSLKNDPEFANRVDLLQDFEFEEASQCVRVSEDGDWVMSTGTYKPQIHVHYLPHLSLSFARHTNTLVRSSKATQVMY